MNFYGIYYNLWKVTNFFWNIYSFKSNSCFGGTFIFVRWGFFYLILIKQKITVHWRRNMSHMHTAKMRQPADARTHTIKMPIFERIHCQKYFLQTVLAQTILNYFYVLIHIKQIRIRCTNKHTVKNKKWIYSSHTVSNAPFCARAMVSNSWPPCSFLRFFSSDQRNTEFCIVLQKSQTNKNKIFINGGNFSSLIFLYPVLQNIKCFLKPFFIV